MRYDSCSIPFVKKKKKNNIYSVISFHYTSIYDKIHFVTDLVKKVRMMTEWTTKDAFTFDELRQLMRILRQRCPWDHQQTHKSLLEPLIEECYELKQAIINEDLDNTEEEIGDVLLQVIFHSTIGEEEGTYSHESVITRLCKKLINRHPHIFGDADLQSSEQVKQSWDEIKLKEKKQGSQTEAMEDIPEVLPSLIRGMKVQKKAAKVGFDWPDESGIYDKIIEELEEVKVASQTGTREDLEEEIGDLIFSTVNLSRFFGINPEFALTNAIEKFINRFRYIESFAKNTGKSLEELTLDELNVLWKQAKSCT